MSDLLKEVFKVLDDKQAENIKIIDLRNNSPFIDYFVIASASNSRKAKALIEAVEDMCDQKEYKILHKNLSDISSWQLLDLGEVVVHIFHDDDREKYGLEALWKDLPTVEL